MERVFKVENAVCKQIRVVTGEEVSEYTVVHETVFKATINLPISHLIRSIHLAKVKLLDGSDDIIAFYKNCYGHNIAILNEDIVNLLKTGENYKSQYQNYQKRENNFYQFREEVLYRIVKVFHFT